MLKVEVDLSKFYSDAKKQLSNLKDQNLKEKGLEALNELVENTPVDTGLAQASWSLSSDGKTITITNNQDYVKYLNAGSSKQAPSMFIEQVLLNYGKPKGPIVTYE
jgi:hypothetical protein